MLGLAKVFITQPIDKLYELSGTKFKIVKNRYRPGQYIQVYPSLRDGTSLWVSISSVFHFRKEGIVSETNYLCMFEGISADVIPKSVVYVKLGNPSG